MNAKRLGGLGKLSDFGQPTPKVEQQEPQATKVEPKTPPKPDERIQKPKEEKLVTVNIKISRTHQDWLADTARLVRDNNDEPVPPADRVYPQHLIQVAIELLKTSDVDWEQVRSVEELKQQLNL
ncbi:MAG TPA: hypothetical protein V6C65_01790 [Allocoleopsis sp.]